jgi:restriction system protein
MSRHGLLYSLAKASVQAQRAKERQQRAQIRAYNQAVRHAEQARRAYTQQQIRDAKEQARLYVESRIADVALQNTDLEDEIAQLNDLLADALSVDDYFDLDTLKQSPQLPYFDPGHLGVPEPQPKLETYLPIDLGMRRFLPGAKAKHDQEIALQMNIIKPILQLTISAKTSACQPSNSTAPSTTITSSQ